MPQPYGNGIDLKGTRAQNAGDPTAAQDLVTRKYMEDATDVGDNFGDSWGPRDFGWFAWTFDPALTTTGTAVTSGTMHSAKLITRKPRILESVTVIMTVAGATLTNVGFAVFGADGVLLASSVNANGATTSNFQSVANRTVTFNPGTGVALPAGPFYIGLWASGTTMFQLQRGAPSGTAQNTGTVLAGGLGLRHGKANTGLTNVAPTQLVQTGNDSGAFWMGVKELNVA